MVKMTFIEARESRHLSFGDNLTVMRTIQDNQFALCCTDPPFNSGRDYNILIKESKANKKAFKDTWTWDDSAMETREDIITRAATDTTYAQADAFLNGFAIAQGFPVPGLINTGSVKGPMAPLYAYLTFMAPRIVEIRRLLKDNGSFYLHCAPSASHYLKALCDNIFGRENFRNEIVWSYTRARPGGKQFARVHDIIFWYSKSKTWTFDKEFAQVPLSEEALRTNKIVRKDGSVWTRKRNTKDMPDVWNIKFPSNSKERLGYPTQKPRALYERMIEASSNPGEIVFDPFCGCGTTIDAAESLSRGWYGIDLTVLALEPIQKRMHERHRLSPYTDYAIDGYPVNMQELRLMLDAGENSQRYRDFEMWAVTRLDMTPTQYVGDGGIDGDGTFKLWNEEHTESRAVKIVSQVKAGVITTGMVSDFRTAMRDSGAEFGILIGTVSATSGVKTEMLKEGHFEYGGTRYPRLQYWQIDADYFDNPGIVNVRLNLPRNLTSRPKLEVHVKENQTQLEIEPGDAKNHSRKTNAQSGKKR